MMNFARPLCHFSLVIASGLTYPGRRNMAEPFVIRKSFNKHLLVTYSMPGPVLGAGNSTVSQADLIPALRSCSGNLG